MDKKKLSRSIKAFKRYYAGDRVLYERQERKWKDGLSSRFRSVFVEDGTKSGSFLESLRALFEDPKARHDIVVLGGGAFYQHQRFLDLLRSKPDPAMLSGLFRELLSSRAPVRNRINSFKNGIDALYRELLQGGTIQLNLISQFLGLCFPNEHYVYKAGEFTGTATYLEYGGSPSDTSTGAKYEYFHKFVREIKVAMNEAGLDDVDLIDVQIFVYRRDWYSPVDLQQEEEQFEKETAKADSLSVDKLVDRIKKATPIPPKEARAIYYYRDANLAALVKKVAEGVCDLCSKDAPFQNRAGKPYLECHHVQHLADGGRDEIANCAALCPNCHVKMHVLNVETDRLSLLSIAQKRHSEYFGTGTRAASPDEST